MRNLYRGVAKTRFPTPEWKCTSNPSRSYETDLFFMLHLLTVFPTLLYRDLSHYVVGRDPWPIATDFDAMIHRILDNSWGMTIVLLSREQF